MKNIYLGLLALPLLAGCSAFSNISVNPPNAALVDGEKVIATYYVQNVSYQLFNFIPFCSGNTWQEGGIEHADDFSVSFFCDNATLDENIKSLDHACDVLGSHRISHIANIVYEDPFWSFFICNRRTIKTQCLILAPKD